MASVDDRVVSIKFDNKDFEKKVTDTVGSIDKLNKSLNFDSAKKAISDLSGAAKSMDLSGMGAGVDTVTARFTALGAVGFSVIDNLVTRAMGAGTSIAKGLSFDQVNSGLKEYEMNLNSIQTILSNTKSKGTTLDEVNVALDELNKYSDLTIYNFADMTQAISKFTAAGVDMGTAVPAIKGVANLAAISGTNNVEAARAMGQLAQAVSSGTLKLRDWMSVDAAGMGGEVFKTHLMQTASAMGTIAKVPLGTTLKDWEKKNGSFRDSLESGWVTADVLTTSLKGLAGELSMDQLLAIGYTKEQALAVIELGKTGMAAATQVKTLSGLFDTVKQAIGSGWSETFKNIFGNFEEAKSTFTAWNNALGAIIGNSAKKRNDFLLLFKKFGGRDNIIDSINMSFVAVLGLIKAFKQAFRDIFPKKSLVDVLVISQKIKAFAATLVMSAETADKVKNVFRGVFAIFGIGFKIVGFLAGVFFKLSKALFNVISGPTLTVLSMLGNVFYALFKGLSGIGTTIKNLDFFKTTMTLIGFTIKVVTNQIKNGLSKIDLGFIDKFSFAWLKLKRAFAFAGGKGSTGPDSPSGILKMLGKFLRSGGDKLVSMVLSLANGLAHLADAVATFAMHVDFAGMFNKLLNVLGTVKGFFSNLFGGVKGAGDAAASKAKTSFELLSKAGSRLSEVFGFLAGIAATFAKVFAKIGYVVGRVIGDIWNAVTGQFREAKFNNVIDLLNVGLFGGLLAIIRKFMQGGVAGILGGSRFMDKIKNTLEQLKGAIKSFSISIQAKALLDIAKAIGILALSLALLSLIDSGKLAKSLAVVFVGLTMMINTLDLLVAASKDKTIDSKTILGLAASLVLIGVALLFYASAVALLGRLNLDTLAKGTAAVVVLMLAMVGAIKILGGKTKKKDLTVGDEEIANIIKQGLVMMFMAKAVKTLSKSVVLLAKLNPDEFKQGMIGIGLIMAGLFAMIYFIPENAASKIGGIFALSAGIGILALAIKLLGAMDVYQMVQGLGAIAAIFLGFAVIAKVVDEKEIVTVGTGLIAMSVAMGILAVVIEVLGRMDPKQMEQGIWGMIGVVTILGLLMVAMAVLNEVTAGGVKDSSEALILTAGAIFILAAAIKLLASIPFGIMLGAIGGLAITFLVLVGAGYLLGPVIPVLLGLGIALSLMGAGAAGLGILIAGVGVGLFYMAKAGMGAADVLDRVLHIIINLIPDFINGIVTGFIIGFGSILEALGKWIPTIIEIVVKLLVQLMTKLIEIAPLITDFISRMLQIVIDVIKRKAPEIIKMLVVIIEALIKALRRLIPKIIDFVIEMLDAFLKGIEDYLDVLIAGGVAIVVAIIDGFTAAVEKVSAAILGFILAVITQLASYVKELSWAGVALAVTVLEAMSGASTSISKAVGRFILDIITGINEALVKYLPRIKKEFSQFFAIIASTIPGFTTALDLIPDSIYKFDAIETTEQRTLRLEGYTKEDAARFTKDQADKIQSSMDDQNAIKVNFQAILDGGPDAQILRGLHSGLPITINAGTSAQNGVNGGTSNSNTNNTTTNNTTVIQTNVSTKELTASEIYKQTVAALKKNSNHV